MIDWKFEFGGYGWKYRNILGEITFILMLNIRQNLSRGIIRSFPIFPFIFFSRCTVTNPAIWLVLYPVCIFLSLPTGNGNAFVSRRVHVYFLAIFHKYISFSGWAVFLSKDVGHYLKPMNNLLILSFLSLKILVSEWICLSNSVITLVDKRPKNRLQLILIVHGKYLES